MTSVLAVDDPKSMRHMLSLTLGNAGFEVFKANNGQEALLKIDECKPDVIVADIDMPNIDGMALARAVRKLPECKNIPILLISTNQKASVEEKALARAAGATGWLCKPLNPERLVATVHSILD